jgi:hypothetical protein
MTPAAEFTPTAPVAPSFRTAFLGFVSSVTFMTAAMVLIGAVGA